MPSLAIISKWYLRSSRVSHAAAPAALRTACGPPPPPPPGAKWTMNSDPVPVTDARPPRALDSPSRTRPPMAPSPSYARGPLASSSRSVAAPAAIVTGFAENVPPPMYDLLRLSGPPGPVSHDLMASALPQIAPIGNPPPTILPRRTMSGSSPIASYAHPYRSLNPVTISSSMNRAPLLRANSCSPSGTTRRPERTPLRPDGLDDYAGERAAHRLERP